MTEKADITIIGAGVIGLAIAAEVAGKDRSVYILEKNEKFGQEQSGRNSQVIHAGFYYEKDSLKTEMCLEGNRRLYEICRENGIDHRQCGKIIVAVNDIEAEEMEKVYRKGRDNDLPLKMLSRREMKELEPRMKGLSAFFSPTTGIIDVYALLQYFAGKASRRGVETACKTEVTSLNKVPDGYEVGITDPTGNSTFSSRVVINCAGLYSDRIAAMAGIDTDRAGYKLHYCKGEFYSVSGGKNRLVNHLIYPVPMTISVGVHVCLDTDWRLRLGPLFYYTNEINYRVDDSRRRAFLHSSIVKALPFIEPDDIAPESCGVMAMLQGPGDDFRDFVIRHEADRGLPGLINLIGIESPGLTSSPAIAGYVSRLVDEIF